MHKNIITQQEGIPTTIGNTCNVSWGNSREMLKQLGWRQMPTIPEIQEGYTRISIQAIEEDGENGKWEVEDVITETPPALPFPISKIALKKAMQAVGQWESFKAVLQQDLDAWEDFNFAVVLMSDDPKVLQFKQVCVQLFGFTEEQVDAMLKSCKSDIG